MASTRIQLVPLLFLFASCGSGNATAPELTPVGLSDVQGNWTLQVRDTSCGSIGLITLQVTSVYFDSVPGFPGQYRISSATWSHTSPALSGVLGGWFPSAVHSAQGVDLVLSDSTNGSSAEFIGGMSTITTVTGTLMDPYGAKPIFTAGSCTYQVTGHHG